MFIDILQCLFVLGWPYAVDRTLRKKTTTTKKRYRYNESYSRVLPSYSYCFSAVGHSIAGFSCHNSSFVFFAARRIHFAGTDSLGVH